MSNCSRNRSNYTFEVVREVFIENRRTELPPEFVVLVNIFAFIVSLLGVLGNGLVCFAVMRNPKMRNPRNVFITNLALADFVSSLTVVPFVLWPQLENSHWKYGESACKFYNTVSGMNVFCNSLTIIAIARDRYFAVRTSRPNEYNKNTPVVIASGMIWITSLLCCIPVTLFYQTNISAVPLAKIERDICIRITDTNNQTMLPSFPICTYMPPNDVIKTLVTVTHLLFLVPIPLAVVTGFNWRLHRFLTHQRQRHRSLTLANAREVQNAPQNNRHKKLTLLLISMVLSHGLFWLPFMVFTWANDFHKDTFQVNPVLFRALDICIQLLAYCSMGANPFLYAYFNSNFKKEFKRLLGNLKKSPCCAKSGSETSNTADTSRFTTSHSNVRCSVRHSELTPLTYNVSTPNLTPVSPRSPTAGFLTPDYRRHHINGSIMTSVSADMSRSPKIHCHLSGSKFIF